MAELDLPVGNVFIIENLQSGLAKPSGSLPLITAPEQALYQAIKRNAWGENVRLERLQQTIQSK